MIKILHLEDSSADVELIDRLLRKSDIYFDKKVVSDREGFLQALKSYAPDIILADHSLPSFDSFAALALLGTLNMSIPFILITAVISEEFAITVMKAGAWDFILKDRLQRLPEAIRNAHAKHTAEKENKAYLRQVIANEALLKETEKLAHIGSWTYDLSTKRVIWSDEAFNIFGYQPGEVEPSFDLFIAHVHPDDRNVLLQNFENSLKGQLNNKIIFKSLDVNNKIRYLQAAFDVSYNDAGQPVALNGFTLDVTEMKIAEISLIESERLLNEAQRIAGLGSWQIGLPGMRLTFSAEACRIFDISDGQLNRLLIRAFFSIHPDDREFARDSLLFSISERKPFNINFRLKRKDGSIKYLQVKGEFQTHGERDELRSIGMVQDITSRTLAEQAIRKSESKLEIKNKELERKNKELEQFAFVSSHDLQEPLTTIASFAGLLNQEYGGRLDEQADMYLSFINESAARMKKLIKDLLDYSRIGVGMALEEVDCNEVLMGVLKDLSKRIRETNAILRLDPLPVVTGYRSGLRQVFQNLISNALKFIGKGDIPAIYISSETTDESWKFLVRDNGIGIDPLYHEKIFIIFQRLHDRSEYQGTGIGLSHCTKIIELHKGRLWVASEPGQGATFYFTIQRNLKE